MLEGGYAAVKAVIERWRLVSLVGVVVLLYHYWQDVMSEDGEATPTSSVGSPASTPDGMMRDVLHSRDPDALHIDASPLCTKAIDPSDAHDHANEHHHPQHATSKYHQHQ